MCACFSVGPLQNCCCYSYHESQEQIVCQNKHSHFRPTGEVFLYGCSCSFFNEVEWLQTKYLLWDGEFVTNRKAVR